MTFARGQYRPELLPKYRSEPLLQAIRGMPCTLRISSMVPGHTCSHADTVIPAHVRTIGRDSRTNGKSMESKVSDVFVVAACQSCHDMLDLRDSHGLWLLEKYPTAILNRLVNAIMETQTMLISAGVINIKGALELKGQLPERNAG